jgi:hypothetical protein
MIIITFRHDEILKKIFFSKGKISKFVNENEHILEYLGIF